MDKQKDFATLEKCLLRTETYILYGAGVVAYESAVAISELYGKKPLCFLVTEKAGNPQTLADVPIYSAAEMKEEWKKLPILIAAPEIYHEQIADTLQNAQVLSCFCMDAHMEYCLMSRYFRKKGEFALAEDLRPAEENVAADRKQADDKVTENLLKVYMAKSHKDVPLKKAFALPKWVIPVQAGRACTEFSFLETADNAGENISKKNPNYCELTVTYWAWKNQSSAYKGICHYRRMLLLTKAELRKCIALDIDVILPLPFVCYPTAKGQYERYISQKDLQSLKQALFEVSPEYLETWEALDIQQYFYNYNMLIAKELIFDEYAKWLFAVLEQAEKYCEPEGVKRKDRYAGYLGELLTTLYFMRNRDKLKIVHAEKNWMV